jgi:hypothetical protein
MASNKNIAFMQTMTIEQIRTNYPNQWILIGNPELKDPDINGSIISKLLSGVVLFASADKRELAHQAPTLRNQVDSTVCIYTGEIPKNRLFLL